MKKLLKIVTALVLSLGLLVSVCAFGACGDSSKTIKVCASDVPHAEVLNECVKDILKKEGYTLEVTILDWTMQNDAVAKGDYDANYFQHVPYLNQYNGSVKLFASCKVHYEPLGIYYGKAENGTPVANGLSFAICDDPSNAIRALQLLEAKGVFSKATEGDNYPISEDGESLTIGATATKWTSVSGVVVNLIAENLLVSSMGDNDFVCLPCNTAYTGKIDASHRAAVEDDPAQVSGKANVIAARVEDYKNNETYKAKIDVLTNAMLSKTVADFFETKYLGAITCNSLTQIDLR